MEGLQQLSRRPVNDGSKNGSALSVVALRNIFVKASSTLHEVDEALRDGRIAETLAAKSAAHRRLQKAEAAAAELLVSVRRF